MNFWVTGTYRSTEGKGQVLSELQWVVWKGRQQQQQPWLASRIFFSSSVSGGQRLVLPLPAEEELEGPSGRGCFTELLLLSLAGARHLLSLRSTSSTAAFIWRNPRSSVVVQKIVTHRRLEVAVKVFIGEVGVSVHKEGVHGTNSISKGKEGFGLSMAIRHHGNAVIVLPARLQDNAADHFHEIGDGTRKQGLVFLKITENVSDAVVPEAPDEGLRLLLFGNILDDAVVGKGKFELADNGGGAFSSVQDGRFGGYGFKGGSHCRQMLGGRARREQQVGGVRGVGGKKRRRWRRDLRQGCSWQQKYFC
ncbi:hypothetical protein DFH08DRAFT_803492 [Mycena albidolilacea]|uniref:Uncharacterized protein n=1 Tax=Mycena albidolilacea TaxID=1033008 RepID=A0AAD7EW72_9AGAR|nr:hypothetical protein DFH08DRAFT_803492 [Mycena albidolilacea]